MRESNEKIRMERDEETQRHEPREDTEIKGMSQEKRQRGWKRKASTSRCETKSLKMSG